MSSMPACVATSLSRLARDTPLIELDWLETNGARVFAKCEFLGPTGSHKDRMYAHMIDHLERAGQVRRGQRLIDFSSGNAGAALAYLGAIKGYPVTIVRPSGLSRAKAVQIESLGARLVMTPAEEGVDGARRAALALASDLGAEGFAMQQTESPLNQAAFAVCGDEIVANLAGAGLAVDGFACGIGTGGTLSGVAKALRRSFPDATILAGEVEGADVNLAEREGRTLVPCKHHLEGLSPGLAFGNTDRSIVCRIEVCSETEAWQNAFELEQHGLLVGPSSGFNLALAKRLAGILPSGSVIVTVLFDAGWKYYGERSQWLHDLAKHRSGGAPVIGSSQDRLPARRSKCPTG